MPNTREKKVTAWQLEQARHRGSRIYGHFNAYCYLNRSCDTCNRWVRLLCKLKNKIEDWQAEIIRSICKGE